jgi:hypothetical protein
VLTRAAKQALTAYIFALFKAIVGSGILSLANAIARWTDNPALIAPVVALSVASSHSHVCVRARCASSPSCHSALESLESTTPQPSRHNPCETCAKHPHRRQRIASRNCGVAVQIKKKKLN